ncbi:MAG: hypothetical protein EAZ85_08025 [Bacteroidetes bacterium]|nr:MAG: hypothetical protein EAZ85_08025 [Bacteroidota bacterium]
MGNFLLGDFLSKILKISSPRGFFTNIFLKILVSTIITTSLFAIIFTQGKTIFILFLPLLLLFYLALKKEKELENITSIDKKNELINYIYLFFISFFIIFYIFWGYFPNEKTPYPNYFFDAIFYSKVSEYIYLTGNENIFVEGNLVSNEYTGVFPYHYFELWLTAFFSNLFGLSYIICYETTLKSYLIIVCIFSFLSCIEQIKKIIITDIILVISFAFVGGIYFVFFDILYFIKQYSSIHLFPMASNMGLSKIVFMATLFTTIVLVGIKNKLHFVIFPVITLALVNFLSIPGIFSGLVLVLLCNEFYHFGIDKKTSRLQILYIFSFFFCIMFFYWFFSPVINITSNLSLLDIIKQNLSDFKSKINYIIGLVISHIAYYLLFLPFIFLCFDNIFKQIKKKQIQFLVLFFFLLFLNANIISSLLTGVTDYPQIYTNNLSAFLYIIPLLLLLIVQKKAYIYYGYIVFITSIAIYHNPFSSIDKTYYTKEYLDTIKTKIQKIKNPLGVSIYTEVKGKQGPATHNSLGAYLKLMQPYFNTINAGTYLMPQSDEKSQKHITDRLKNSVFVRYAKQTKQNNFDELLISFIKKNKIEYIIIEKITKIPISLNSYIDEIITDTKSGEKFIILKK